MELSVKHLRQAKLIFQYSFQCSYQDTLSKRFAVHKSHKLKYWIVSGTFLAGVWQTGLPSRAGSSPEPQLVDKNTKSDTKYNIDEEVSVESASEKYASEKSASEKYASEIFSEAVFPRVIDISPPETDENISKAEFSSSDFAFASSGCYCTIASSGHQSVITPLEGYEEDTQQVNNKNIQDINNKNKFISDNSIKNPSLKNTLRIKETEENPTFSTFYETEKFDIGGSNSLVAVNGAEQITIQDSINIVTQLTSVSELSDVEPTDWAYQSLKTLIERYGVLSGFPDRSFKGNKAISRYEFAAALSATIDKLEDLLAKSLGNEYIQQDMIIVRRLQRDYKNVLEQVRQRLGRIDQKVYDLEQQQFSPTTKLKGEQIFAITDGSAANQTVISRTRLELSTSFNKTDLLVTQFESGNNGGDAIALEQKEDLNLLGVDGAIANGGGLDYAEVESGLRLRRLYYTFRPTRDTAISLGTKMSPRDFIDQNSYANNSSVDFSSGFFLNNPLIVQNQIDRRGGAGVAVIWKPKKQKFAVRSLYIAGNGNQPSSTSSRDNGLFGDPYQASLELEYAASKELTFRLQYTNSEVNNTDINAWGLNAEYVINRNAGIFTRLGYGSYQGFNTVLNRDLDLNPLSWSIGLGIRNLFLPGTTAGVALGQPFVSKGLGNSTQTNFEAFYNLQFTDNISITPTFSLVNDADNEDSNGLIWQSTLRTVIGF
ncbi:MAG: iron uptake porin [Cyanobacteria bacterium P01_A01_bin.45]